MSETRHQRRVEPTPSTQRGTPLSPTCRNCGAPAPGRFCATCGQTTTVEPPTARAVAHDFVEHYVALEGALWRTLGALLLRPGRLTLEYFAGRRGRYIPPLRLYLTFSLILFALIGITGGDLKLGSGVLQFQASAPVNRSVGADALNLDLNPKLDISKAPAWLGRLLERVAAMSPAERSDRMRNGMNRSLPYVMMLLVPLLALITQIAYWNRRRLYGEHLVVALHAQTVVFIFMLLSAPPWPNWVGNLLLALLIGHGAIAMRGIYGGRFVPTLVRLAMIIGMYSALVFAAIGALAFAALLF